MNTVPTDENLQKIVTCELMPLFMNSLQQVQNRYVSPSQHIASMVVMERDLMMRFTPPTEITPEPTPEFVLNYDASCLPNLTPPSETTPEPGDGESLNLVTIPPLEGEFTLLETGTMQQSQSNIIFLEVDTTVDDANLNACTPAPEDCSLRGAIEIAKLMPIQHYVILISNGTYSLTQHILIEGTVSLVGLEAYTNSQFAGVVITQNGISQNLTPVTIRNFNINHKSTVSTYNVNFRGGRSYASAMLNITGSDVYIYNSRFEDNIAPGYGGAILIADQYQSSPTSFVKIINTVFEGNQSYQGGAILADEGIASIHLECVTFRNNHAGLGGAIATYYSYAPFQFNGTIRIDNSNFINNTANSGGAIHRQGGSIVIGDNHWSPNANATPTASNSVVGMPAPTLYEQSDNEFPLDCEVPPPPTQIQMDVCLAKVSAPTQGYNGWTVRNGPYSNSTSIGTITENTDVVILGGNSTRYLIEYVQGVENKQGWILQNGVKDLSGDKCLNLPILNETGDELEAVHNYALGSPPSDWLSLNCQLTGTFEECAKVTYFIYYELFYQIYKRDPNVHELIAVVFQNELSQAYYSGIQGRNLRSGVSGDILTLETLRGNYWSVVRTHIPDCQINPNCISQMDLDTFVGEYLMQIQSWNQLALPSRTWFIGIDGLLGTVDDYPITTINNPLDLQGTPIRNLFLRDYDFQNAKSLYSLENLSIGLESLTKQYTSGGSVPFQWGNYRYNLPGYDFAPSDSRTVFCMKTRVFIEGGNPDVTHPPDDWSDDVLVFIVVNGLGVSASSYSYANTPPWIFDANIRQRIINNGNREQVNCD